MGAEPREPPGREALVRALGGMSGLGLWGRRVQCRRGACGGWGKRGGGRCRGEHLGDVGRERRPCFWTPSRTLAARLRDAACLCWLPTRLLRPRIPHHPQQRRWEQPKCGSAINRWRLHRGAASAEECDSDTGHTMDGPGGVLSERSPMQED